MTTVFFDRTCGKRLPRALKILDLPIESHADHFSHDTPDDVWLAAVARRGWVVVTNDKRIRFNQAERRAIVDHRVGCFVFTSGNRTKWGLLQILAKAWAGIQDIADTSERPFIFSLHGDGSLHRLYPQP